MRRTTLILIIVLVVVLLGGGAYVWFMRDKITFPWDKATVQTNTSATNSTTIINTPTNTTPNTVSLPTEVKGDTAVQGTLTVEQVPVKFTSMQRTTQAEGQTAAKGQTFLVVYFDTVEPAQVEAVDMGLAALKVFDGKTSYPQVSTVVISTYTKNGHGTVRFAIPESAKTLQLQLGSGKDIQTLKLPS